MTQLTGQLPLVALMRRLGLPRLAVLLQQLWQLRPAAPKKLPLPGACTKRERTSKPAKSKQLGASRSTSHLPMTGDAPEGGEPPSTEAL
eukprot:2020605-Alexandrium_andersonii.AAC.1